jgi:septal ring factor EnvC (AmiA/AmiB activator)
MPWPKQRTSANEAQLQRANDALALQLLWVKRELTDKERIAERLKYLLRRRTERIDELTAQVDQLRMQNRKLDEEAEHWAQRYAETARPQAEHLALLAAPQRDAAMLSLEVRPCGR